MPSPSTPPALVCPACAAERPGAPRIGSRRGACRLCNRFAAALRRRATAALAERHPADYAALRARLAAEVYADLTIPKEHR